MTRRRRPPVRPRLHVEELEPRVLYSADAALLLDPTLGGLAEVRVIAPPPAPAPAAAVQTLATPAMLDEAAQRRELVVVDARVADPYAVLDALARQRGGAASYDLVVLDADGDRQAQLTELLGHEQGLAAVHLVGPAQDAAPTQRSLGEVAALAALADGAELIGWQAGPGGELLRLADPAVQPLRSEIVFIDARVADIAPLLDELVADRSDDVVFEVIRIDASRDGLAQVSAALAGRSGIDALHLISHGASGQLLFGSGVVDTATLATRAGELGGWAGALSADADLLLYGCEVGAGEAGVQFTQALADATGADVAASDDRTGAAAQGGDWQLETRRGRLQATVLQAGTWGGSLGLTAQGGETLVNTTTSGGQTENWSAKTVAMDASGNYVVVWMDGSGVDGSGIGIYAQRYSAAGVAQGSQFQVNTYTADNQRNPQVAMAGNGSFVVVWESNGQDGSSYGVFAQRYSASGVAQGGEFRVNSTTALDQTEAAVAMDATGNFVVTWQSWSQDAVNSAGIYAQRYNSSGVAQGGEFRVNTYTTDDQSEPSIAMDAAGNFVIVWASWAQDGSDEGIYAQRYDSGGVAQGGAFKVNTYTTGYQGLPVVAMDGNGFVVVWESYAQDGSVSGVFGQRYNPSGVAQGSEFQINTTTTNNQQNPVVAMTTGGGFVVTWQSMAQDGSFDGVYARQYDGSGTALSAETRVNTTTTDYQDVPSVAADANGHLVVAWHGNGVGDSDGVFAQRYLYAVAPVLTLGGYSGTYVENAGVIFDASATVTDADTTVFSGGQLLYQITANGSSSDELGIRNQGSSAGLIGLSGSNVTYGGTVIGSYTGSAGAGSFGNGSTALTVTFNGSASVAAVQALVRNITYRNTSDNPGTATRTINLTVSDGTGMTSTPAVVTMAVTAVNDAPVITSNGGGATAAVGVAENSTTVAVVSATDAEGAALTYSILGGADAAKFSIDAGSGVLSFVSAPDYENPTDGGADNVYDVTVQVSDGSATDTQALAVTVTNVDEQIGAGASSSATTTGATSLTWFHTTSASSHDILIVTVSVRQDVPVTSVTYGGTALTQVGSRVDPSGKVRAEMWYLLAPPTGTANVVVTLSGSANATAGATTFYNVSQTTPFGSVTTGSGSGDPSLTLASAVGELVVDAVADRDVDSQVVGAGQTLLWTGKAGTGANDSWAGSSTEAGAASVTMSWTTNGGGAGEWAAVALSLKPFVNNAPVVATTGSVLAYTENGATTAVDSALTVGDADGDTLVGATVSISANYASGQDTLAFSTQNGITGSWNAGTGVLTLSGSATVAQYQAALRSITYANTSDNPSTATRTVSFTVSDGTSSNTATRNITVTATNDLPVAAADAGSGNEDVAINGNVLANDTDADGGALTATLVSGSSNGSLTLNADGSYSYTPNANWNGSDSFQYLVSDGSGLVHYWALEGNGNDVVGGAHGTVTGTTAVTGDAGSAMQFDEIDDVVVVPDFTYTNAFTVSFSFRLDDISGSTYQYLYSHGDYTAVNSLNILVGESGAGVGNAGVMRAVMRDSNDGAGSGVLTVDVNSLVGDGQWHEFTLVVAAGGTSKIYLDGTLCASDSRGGDAFDPTGSLYLGGRQDGDPSRLYGNALDSVKIYNRDLSSQEVAQLASTTQQGSVTLTVTSVNDAPVISAVEGSALAYSENAAATAVTATLTLTDIDSTNLSGATVQITGNYASGQDVLAFTNQNGITGSWNAGTGVLTLSGSATVANYQAALRSITYANGSDNPSTATRTVSFSVNDGMVDSNTATRNVSVAAVNDSPTVGGAMLAATTEDAANPPGDTIANLFSGSFADVDAGASLGGILVTHNPLNASQGAWQYSTDAGGNWHDIDAIAYPQSLALDAATRVRFLPAADFNGFPDSLSVRALDDSYAGAYTSGATRVTADATSPGGSSAISASLESLSTSVVAVNDAPLISFVSGSTVLAENAGALIVAPAATVADVDGTALTGGQLHVYFAENGQAEDRIAIRNQGSGAGQIGVSGTDVSYEGVVIGNWTGGTDGLTPLVVTFNSSATTVAVQALARNVTYENVSESPSTAVRTMAGYLTDGAGGSSNIVSGTLSITPVNDAPTLSSSSALPSVSEDDVTNSGFLVSFLADGANDADAGALKGLAVTSVDDSHGTWQYTLDGTTWQDIGAVSQTNARLLPSDTVARIRFVPAADWNGVTGPFAYQAWDQTSGVAGGLGDASVYGGSTAFSFGASSSSLSVMAVNDAPVNALPGTQVTPVNVPLTLSVANGNAISIGDADAANAALSVTLSATHGTLTLAGMAGLGFTTGDGTADASMTFTGTAAAINAALDGLVFTPAAGYQGSAVLSLATNDLGNTGSGGALADSDSLNIAVGGARFQEGADGYGGTQDTWVSTSSPGTDHGAQTTVVADDNSLRDAALLRFDNLFGTGAGQIPAGAIIQSVSLSVYVTNADALDFVALHRMLQPWTEASTFDSLISGVSTGGAEAGSALLTFSAGSTGWNHLSSAQLTATVQAWANGEANHGWAFISDNADLWTFASSENGTVSQRPYLSVSYVLPQAPVVAVSGTATSYTENSAPVAVDPALTVSDADSTHLAGATVRISANHQAGEDVLAFTSQFGITGSWDANAGILTLSGQATVAQYQQALRSVTYANTSEAPTADARTLAFSVTDVYSGLGSALVSRSLNVLPVNDAPTGGVTIDDVTPTQGQTLTATNTLADADGIGPISYQWQRNGVAIGGATGSSYTTSQADVGAVLSVVASYTDALGASESVASADTSAVANVNDAPTGSVTIDDLTPTQGQTLTATNTLADADGLGPISYQWQRNGVAIGGATGSSYSTSQADVGAVLSVVASYTDALGSAESVASADTSAVANVNDAPTGGVTIDDLTPTQGQTLTATNTLADADGLGPINYQWQRNGVAIGGATGSSYTTSQADVGAVLSVVASYTDALGASESVASAGTAAVTNVNDAPTGGVTIDDSTPIQGQTLTVSNTLADADGLGPISYQWQRNGVAIGGATGSSYTTSQADVGAVLSVVASYTDALGSAESVASADTSAVANVNDAPTGSVTIDDSTPIQGQTLTVSNTLADADGLGPISYQWQRNGVAIGGATGSSYTTSQADVGAVLSVVASYTDALGASESVASADTSAVANVNDAPTGSVTIDDLTPTQGQTLTVSNTLADADGLGPISYQWQRNGVAIGGATGSSYTTSQADVGAVLSVVASYTDALGSAESVASADTSAVANVNDAPTGSVTIDDSTPTQGQTLTATNTLADADGLGTINYQWQRNGVAIGGATGSSYTTSQADVGAVLSVVASYTDALGASESVASAGTAAVTNVNDAPTAVDGVVELVEDQGHTFSAADFGFADVDSADALGAVRIEGLPGVGSLTLDGVAVVAGQEIGSDRLEHLIYKPPADAFGAALAVLQVRVADVAGVWAADSQQVVLDVQAVNDAPRLERVELTLTDGASLLLSDAQLLATDVDSPSTEVVYRVTSMSHGHFEAVDQPGVAIDQFTQADVSGHRVRFVALSSSNLPSFVLAVGDGAGTQQPVSVRVSHETTALLAMPGDESGSAGATPDAPDDPSQPAGPALPPGPPAPMGTATVKSIGSARDGERGGGEAMQAAVLQAVVEGASTAEDAAQHASRQVAATTAAVHRTPLVVDLPSSEREQQAAQRLARLELLFEAGWELDLGQDNPDQVVETLALVEPRRAGRSSESSGLADEGDAPSQELTLATDAAQAAGAVLTAGSVWWALRAGGLVTSLLGSLPTWRHVDLLAVLPDDDGAEGWNRDADDEAERDEMAFDRLLSGASDDAMENDPR